MGVVATNLQYGNERRARLCSRLARSRTRDLTMIETSEDPASATLNDPGSAASTASADVEVAAPVRGPIHPGVGVLSVAKERYSPQWLSRQQVLTRLARYYQVLWMNPATEWRRALRGGRLAEQETHIEGLPDSFTVYDPPAWLPIVYKPSWLGKFLARQRFRGFSLPGKIVAQHHAAAGGAVIGQQAIRHVQHDVALVALARALLHEVLDLEHEVVGKGAEQAEQRIVIG